jgi:DNA replication protein DnaC
MLAKTIARYGRVDLLYINELGYVVLDRRGADVLFQVLTEREETNSVAITSSRSFSAWTNTFTDPRRCSAIYRPAHLRWQHHRDRQPVLAPHPFENGRGQLTWVGQTDQ